MTDAHNPYDFTNPIKDPSFFAGRIEVLKDIDYYLDLASSKSPKFLHLAILGKHSSGKTSLLNIITKRAEEKGIIAVKIALNNEMIENELLLFKEIFTGLTKSGMEKGMYDGTIEKVQAALKKFSERFTASFDVPLGVGHAHFGVQERTPQSGISQEAIIQNLKEFYVEAKKCKIPAVVVLLDECDLLSDNVNLVQKIRNSFTTVDGYMLVVTGTENMFSSFNETYSPLPRIFKKILVENFRTIEETRDGLLKPLSEEETKRLDFASVIEIHELTNGNPYEVNLIAHFMYKRMEESKDNRIRLSIKVLEDVYNELERLRRMETHPIADRIKEYHQNHLKPLVSLIEFPKVSKENLIEYMLLDRLEEITLREASIARKDFSAIIDFLLKEKVIRKTNENLLEIAGDHFDFLYLKYLASSKDVRISFIGDPEFSCLNAWMKFQRIMVDSIPQFRFHTVFDGKLLVSSSETGTRVILGFKESQIPPGKKEIVFEINLKQREEEFYLGRPNSTRFRANIRYLKSGFVSQVWFEKTEHLDILTTRLNDLIDRFEICNWQILLNDEIYWNNEGIRHQANHESEQALNCYMKSIEINPDFELPHANMGNIYFDLQRYDNALDEYNKALSLKPGFNEVLASKGRLLVNMKRNSEAIIALEEAAKFLPERWDIWHNMSIALFNLKRFPEAKEKVERSLKIFDGNPMTWTICGDCAHELKLFDRAIECYEHAIRIAPQEISAVINLSIIQNEIGNHDQAKTTIEKAIAIAPNDIDLLIQMSMAFYYEGNYEIALSWSEKAIVINSLSAVALYNKACFLSMLGKTQEALDFLEKAICIEGNWATYAMTESDFDNIRHEDRFQKIMSTAKIVA